MTNPRLRPELQAALDALLELEHFLDDQGEPFWATNVRRCADHIETSDAYGLARFLGLFGGMGSLNDLVLFREGLSLTGQNDRLAALRSRAWAPVSRLKQEVDSAPDHPSSS